MHPDFDQIFDRFDTDEIALRYIWEDGVVKGIFVGAIVSAIVAWVIS